MPRATVLTPAETNEHFAYALWRGWSASACCRHTAARFTAT
jgi:hypothetical protein